MLVEGRHRSRRKKLGSCRRCRGSRLPKVEADKLESKAFRRGSFAKVFCNIPYCQTKVEGFVNHAKIKVRENYKEILCKFVVLQCERSPVMESTQLSFFKVNLLQPKTCITNI